MRVIPVKIFTRISKFTSTSASNEVVCPNPLPNATLVSFESLHSSVMFVVTFLLNDLNMTRKNTSKSAHLCCPLKYDSAVISGKDSFRLKQRLSQNVIQILMIWHILIDILTWISHYSRSNICGNVSLYYDPNKYLKREIFRKSLSQRGSKKAHTYLPARGLAQSCTKKFELKFEFPYSISVFHSRD